MRQYVLIILIIVQATFIYLQASENDTLLEWNPNYRIEWNDFQGEPNTYLIEEDSIKAVTSTVVLFSLALDGNKMNYEVKCFMDRKKSWTILKDSSLLEHERIHFDIAELYKRKIVRAFDSLIDAGITDFAVYSVKAREIKKQGSVRQEMYDNQTWLGTFRDIQAIWAEEIEAELKALPCHK